MFYTGCYLTFKIDFAFYSSSHCDPVKTKPHRRPRWHQENINKYDCQPSNDLTVTHVNHTLDLQVFIF